MCVCFSYGICLYHPVSRVYVNAEFIRHKCTYNFPFPTDVYSDYSLSVLYKSGTWAASWCKLTTQLICLPSLWLKPESSSICRHFIGVNHLADVCLCVFRVQKLRLCWRLRVCRVVVISTKMITLWLSFFYSGVFWGVETGIIVFMMVKGFSYFLLVW